jgi:hypothetical protein
MSQHASDFLTCFLKFQGNRSYYIGRPGGFPAKYPKVIPGFDSCKVWQAGHAFDIFVGVEIMS